MRVRRIDIIDHEGNAHIMQVSADCKIAVSVPCDHPMSLVVDGETEKIRMNCYKVVMHEPEEI